MLWKAFGNSAMSHKWYKDFKEGRERVDDLERSTDDQHVNKKKLYFWQSKSNYENCPEMYLKAKTNLVLIPALPDKFRDYISNVASCKLTFPLKDLTFLQKLFQRHFGKVLKSTKLYKRSF